MGGCVPASGLSLTPSDFIAKRLALTPLAFRPDIALHRPTPQSRLAAWLIDQGRADDPPYWAYAWAGGAALALYLRDRPQAVAGKIVVDFGAGSGLVGIAAARAGARKVWAIEPDPIGQVALALNARANGVDLAPWDQAGLPPADTILAGDVFYSPQVAAKTLPLLAGAAAEVLVGDPFRRHLPRDRFDLLAEYQVPDMGGGAAVRAGIFALRGAPGGNAA